jgi:hypothetical protein
MLKRIASIFSIILHPVFMPMLGIFIVFNSSLYNLALPVQFKKFVYLITLLCDVLIPLTLIPVLLYFRQVQQITMDEKRERLIPLFLSMVCLSIGYYLVSKFSPIKIINMFLLSASVIAFLILVISIFWKISIHMAGIGGITALIAILSFNTGTDMTIILSIVVIMSGIIASSRLALEAHSPMQLFAGYGIGLCTVGGFLIRWY